jgi:2-oxoglutarate ferredoxin oxidoreductase subunit alpha
MRLAAGNEAVIDGALAAGCRLFAGYPITPATEILEVAALKFPSQGRVVIPVESEIAAIHMVAGASLAGHRAMTATSGIGLSLMTEALSFFSGLSELPGVVVVQQRWGPGDGSLGPGQDTYRQATKAPGHGDFRVIVLAPASVQETVDLVRLAFDLADQYRLFVIVLGDQISALTTETYEVPPPMTLDRRDDAFVTRGGRILPELVAVDSKAGDFNAIETLARRWEEKYRTIAANEARYQAIGDQEDLDLLIVSYGSLARVVNAALPLLAEEGVKAALFRPITLWPFPHLALSSLAAKAGLVVTAELAMGQLYEDVRLSLGGQKSSLINWLGGVIPTPHEVAETALKEMNANLGGPRP